MDYRIHSSFKLTIYYSSKADATVNVFFHPKSLAQHYHDLLALSPTAMLMQAFLLAAMKFHCYVRALPLRAQADSELAWLVIQRGIEYLCNLVKTRVQGAARRCLS